MAAIGWINLHKVMHTEIQVQEVQANSLNKLLGLDVII